LPVWSSAALHEAAERGMEEDPGALVRLALAEGAEADPRTMRLLERALHHSDKELRISAIEAASLTQWPAAKALLAWVRENDPDQEVRRYADEALDALN